MEENNFIKYYDLESYIFGGVSKRFHKCGFLSAFDFFTIIIWKANRAKSKISKQILGRGYDNLDDGVKDLTNDIYECTEDKRRLECLMKKWGFRLPMSSAILTVLYPDIFTVYDVRVCETLNIKNNLDNITNFDKLWSSYLEYKNKVFSAAEGNLSLRDSDRYLWGKSFYDQLNNDISIGFTKKII